MRKNKNSKIKIVFNLDTGKIIGENYFDINTKLKDIFIYFDNNFSNQGYKLKKDYKLFSTKIKPNHTIYDLISIENKFNNKNNILINKEIYIPVIKDINNNNNENEEIYDTILFPKLNPFELIEYNPLKYEIRYIKLSSQIIDFCNIYKFSKESAFCNGEKDLYMSGGLYNGKTLNYFWIINKKDYKIFKKIMPMYKKYHSMLYIPDNFILIAGGDSLSSFIYDIENKQFIRWAYMNKKYFQPGLILSGDFAYSFSSLSDKKNENNFFERTDLTSKNPKWEKIFPIFDNKYLNNFNSLFFGMAKCDGDDIILLGGEKNENRYKYNTIVNKMFLSDEKNLEISFWDKNFYNINDKYKIGIPLNFDKEHAIYLLNKKSENLKKIICSPKNNTKDVYDVIIYDTEYNEKKENEEGIITIKKNEETLLEEKEIIIIEDFNKKKDELKLNKTYSKKKYFYLPNYIIVEQFIDRELNNDNNTDKENNLIINEIYFEQKDVNDDIKKRKANKYYLYIPNTIIDEQIINREVIPLNKGENNNNEIIHIESNFTEKINDENISPKKPLIKKEIFYITNSDLEEQLIQRDLLKFHKKKKNIELTQKNSEDDINNKLKEDLIIINYNNEKEKNDLNINNYNKKINKLYLPLSSFDEQILERKVDINSNEPKIKKKIYKINLDNNINDIDIMKEKEIINELNNEINDENKENNKIIKNKAKIYIPLYIIEEQIINREIKEN